ncbi:hypothetical protein WDZ92_31330 [Nostoc sp. NIES-2111]
MTLAMGASSNPAPQSDPVFAAIEAHKRAQIEWLAAVDAESDLDEAMKARCGRLRPAIDISELPDGLREVYSTKQIDFIVGRLFGEDAEAGEHVRRGLYERLDAAEPEFSPR